MGISGNEEADRLAKEELNSSVTNLDINSEFNNSLNRLWVVSYWKDGIRILYKIDSKLRKFLKYTNNKYHHYYCFFDMNNMPILLAFHN